MSCSKHIAVIRILISGNQMQMEMKNGLPCNFRLFQKTQILFCSQSIQSLFAVYFHQISYLGLC